MSKLPTQHSSVDRHQSVTASLELYGVTTPASEAEGIICGLIIAGHYDLENDDNDPTDDTYQWLSMITGTAAASREADERVIDTVKDMRSHLLAALVSDEFDVQLLLPRDDEAMSVRFEAIASWCQGFLFGFLHDREVDIDALPNDVPEIINDIMAIAESDNDTALTDPANQAGDDDDRALMEIEQYLRVGVQLLFEELVAGKIKIGSMTPKQPALH